MSPQPVRVPIEVAIVALLASIRRQLKDMEEQNMANFDALDSALNNVEQQITKLADEIANAPTEDPATQAKLDAIAERLTAAAENIDAITSDETTTPPAEGGGGTTPPADNT